MTHGGNVWQGNFPEEWLDFSANLRPEGPPDWVIEAIRQAMPHVRYYPDVHASAARKALSDWLGIPPEMALPTNGGIAALALAMQVNADTVFLPTPCFGEYERLAHQTGKRVQKISILQDGIDCIEAQLTERCLVCLGNPVNPLGRTFSREELLRLLAVIEQKQGYLLVDEAFIAYCPEHTLVGEIAGHERLIIAQSMTKLLSIPGVRLGCLLAHPRLLKGLAQRQLTWELNCFADAVACALPEHANEAKAEAEIAVGRRAQLTEALQSLPAYVYPSSAPFVLARFEASASELQKKLKAQKILVRTCEDFDGIMDDHHLRLAVKDERSNNILIQALKEALACVGNH